MLFNTPRITAFAALLSPAIVTALDTVAFATLLKSKLSPAAKVFFPSDANYTNEVTLRSSKFDQPTYYATVQPAIVSDVQTIVCLASHYNIPFLATGGGHSGTITQQGLHGLQIDLKIFKSVAYNAADSTITVGGGVIMEDTFDTISAAGKELQITSSSCVGLIGAAIGGGVGRLQGLHGLITDALVSADIVTASGDHFTASETENSDLFWAIRGTGANFGIITSATFKVYNASNGGLYLNADFAFYSNASTKYWETLKSFDTTLPAALSLTSSVRWNATANAAYVYLNAVYAGPKAEGLAYLAPFFALDPFLTDQAMVSYGDINNAAFFGQGDSADCAGPVSVQQPFSDWGLGIKEIDVATFDTWYTSVNNFYLANPALRAISTTLQRFPTNAVLAQPKDAASYPATHREIILHFLFINLYDISNATLNDQVNSFMVESRSFLQETSGFADLTLYDNYAHGDEGPATWYTAQNLARLIPLKKVWDPKRLFSWTNPIPS